MQNSARRWSMMILTFALLLSFLEVGQRPSQTTEAGVVLGNLPANTTNARGVGSFNDHRVFAIVEINNNNYVFNSFTADLVCDALTGCPEEAVLEVYSVVGEDLGDLITTSPPKNVVDPSNSPPNQFYVFGVVDPLILEANTRYAFLIRVPAAAATNARIGWRTAPTTPTGDWTHVTMRQFTVSTDETITIPVQAYEIDAIPAPPSNDEFANATPIVLNSIVDINQSVLGATVSGNEPDLWCVNNLHNASVWFSVTPQKEATLLVITGNSTYDTVVGIFTSTVGNLNLIACNDDEITDPPPVTSSLGMVNVSPGQTYHVLIGQKGSDPIQVGSDTLTVRFSLTNNFDHLAIFDPNTANTEINHTPLDDRVTNYTNTPPPLPDGNQRWVMGDWNGDGVKTPGIFHLGAFFYTNHIGPTPFAGWSPGFFLGNPPSRGDVVAGRFAAGFPNDTGNDCIGWVDSNTNGAGDLRFSLKYWCDMTQTPQSIGGVLTPQWLAAPLGDSQGFAGTHQWVYGDWDNDGLDEPGVRRGEFITRSTNAPSEGAALYGAGMAQRWAGPGGTTGPGGYGFDEGVFVAGDWNGDDIDTWGVLYANFDDDFHFYYRDVFGFNPGPFQFRFLEINSEIVGNPYQVDSHHSGTDFGSATPVVVNQVDTIRSDTSRNVEADLSVSKAGNYTFGEVGLVGDSIVWTITVSNTGTAPANGVQITDNVPTELRVDDALAGNGSISVRGQVVTFTAESIGVGETMQFQVVTTILSQPASGSFANSVNVLVPDGDGGGSDANLVASGTVESVDGLPATGYTPRFRW